VDSSIQQQPGNPQATRDVKTRSDSRRRIRRRTFLARAIQVGAFIGTVPNLARGATPKVGESFVETPRPIVDPKTGLKLIQLTSGDCFDMPMYYYIPTYGADNKTIVFQRYDPRTGECQLYKIYSGTGLTMRLTDAKTPNSLWRPHLQAPGFGVRDLLCAVNAVTNEAIYFDGNEIRAVHLDSLSDRLLGRVPPDRVPSGLTGVSPNGRLFVYPHFDRAWWEANLPPKPQPERWHPKDSQLDVLDINTGRVKTLMYVNFWITHSNFYDNDRILFCHTATDYAILMTDLRYPGQYENIGTHSEAGWPNHYHATRRGVTYEMLSKTPGAPVIGGIYNPDTRARREFKLGISTGRLHIGRDPDARLWFFETNEQGKPVIVYFPELAPDRVNPGQALISGDYATYSNNQRSHYHPSLTPDRKHILFTGGDSRNQTNHLFLLDIDGLQDTKLVS
jgi:hypothetical protein